MHMLSFFRVFLLLCVLFSTAAISFGQNTTLSFRPLRAEWSATLQRIVMVSTAPDLLHLFHPVARTVESIALAAAPQSLSISPNGLFAAVGHVGATTYIDLSTRSVVRRFTYSFPETGFQHGVDAVLGNEWLYVLGPEKNEALTIRLSTGAITRTLQFWEAGGLRRLHPEGTALYTMPSATVGVFSRHSISTGGDLGPSSNSPYFGVLSSNQYAGGLWFSPDGKRIYAGHGGIARYHPDAARDMARLGQFYPAPVRSLSEAAGRIAVIPSLASTPGSTGTEAADNTVILIAADNFRELGRLAIPEFPEGAHGHGRWAFFNSAGSALHVVYGLQSTAGFAVQTYELANPSPCTATFSAFDMTVGSEGALRTADIAAAGNCLYNAVSTADWVQIVNGGFGTGNQRIRLHIRANATTATRTATVALGTQTLRINQAGRTALPAQQVFSYKVADAEFSKALDRVVLVSEAPNELHLYDPMTRSEQFVALPFAPLSVSVSPDGMKAAAGHRGHVSIVNLQTRAVEKVLETDLDAEDVLLAGQQFVYAFSHQTGTVIDIGTGVLQNAVRTRPYQPWVRLHASETFAFVSNFEGWNRVTVGAVPTEPVTPTGSACGNAWVSEDGKRLYTVCTWVYHASESTADDGVVIGTLPHAQGGSTAAWIVHSGNRRQIAAISIGSNADRSPVGPEVRLYSDDGLALLGRVWLSLRADGAESLHLQGRWLFWNQASTRLYAITQINPSQPGSNAPVPLSDFALEVVAADALASCSVDVTPRSLNAPATGGTQEVTVHAGTPCVWTAESA